MCIEWNDDWLIKYIYEHKNSNNMNEYRGFKVGDRVEITFSSAHPIKGTITSFGDRKLGGFAEPDTMDVWISETTRYDMIYLVSHDLIKKLPKYAVGDVVRRNNKQLIKCEITSVDQLCDKTHIYTLSDCGSARFSESMLITFDGFRVGDTVFTVKRGKGKIVADRESMPRRFKVVFDADKDHPTIICRHPKTTNLIPTESLYKEALNKTGYAFKIDVAYVQEYVAKPKNEAAERQAEKIAKIKAAGEAFYQAAKNMAAAIGRTTDQIKFPSGGVVYQCPPIPEHLIVSREPIMKFQVAPPKPTFSRSAEGKIEFVDKEGGERKYRCSKFAVGEKVLYCGQKAEVAEITWKDGKFTYSFRSNSFADNIPEENICAYAVPSAKFKVGDAVYFDRKKWDVEDVATNECKIRISASAGSCTREFRAWTVVKESDLRLWVETKFTEWLSSFDDKWVKNDYYIDPSWTIMYIGKIVGKDTFVATGLSGSPALFRGIKGDDL